LLILYPSNADKICGLCLQNLTSIFLSFSFRIINPKRKLNSLFQKPQIRQKITKRQVTISTPCRCYGWRTFDQNAQNFNVTY